MGGFADKLRVGIDETTDKMEAARRDGDYFGAAAYRERLAFLRRTAYRHGLGPWPRREAAGSPSDTCSGHATAVM